VPSPSTWYLYERIRRGEPAPRPGGQASREPPPWQLPPDVGVFVGRQAELTALDARPAGSAGCVVTGTAGVGKTALVVHWAHRVADRFPGGCLYADLEGFGPREPIPPDRVLLDLLRGLDAGETHLSCGVHHLAAQYRSLVHGRRILIVLDNARSAEQVRPLLPAAPGCAAVVTSRDSLAGLVARDGAHRIALEPLRPADAADLLRALIGGRASAEPSAVTALVESCSRLPLALRLTAELAVARPRERLADLADELADESGLLDALDAPGDPRAAVRTVFSWSYRALPAPAAHAFRLLGLHRGHDFDARTLAVAAGIPERESARALATLTAAHLVTRLDHRRSSMNHLLRAYARETAEQTDSRDDREAAIVRLSAHCQQTPRPSGPHGLG
jgi:hypothetical protein